MVETATNALLRASSVPLAIREWLVKTGGRQTDLARALGVHRQFINQVLTGRRELPDDQIAQLPAGLRETVADIRARRYEAMAALVRRSVAPARTRATDLATLPAEHSAP